MAYSYLGSPAHMLKGNTDKLKSRIEVCFFIGYPKRTKGGLIYSPNDPKVIVSSNATFLEQDYVIDHKPRSRIILEEMRRETPTYTSSIPSIQEKTSQERVINVPLPRHSGRITETRVDPE